jgi:hypothetical protein
VLRSIGAELVADDAGELAAGLGRLASLNCQVCAQQRDHGHVATPIPGPQFCTV